MYERKSGPIVRTVYAEGDRVMVRFDGEEPYVMSIMWTAADAERAVRDGRQALVDSEHAWALSINRTIDYRRKMEGK